MAELVYYTCFVLLFLVKCVSNSEYLDLPSSGAEKTAQRHPASDFSRHTLVKPRIYHGREKRQISTTKEKHGHVTHLTITIEVDNEDLTLDLTLNKQLIPKGFFHRYQENGKHKVYKPTAEEVDLCHYHGKVRDHPDSWVALSTCDGLSGVIFDGKEMHYIEKDTKVAQGDLEGHHYLYKHSDLVDNGNKKCGYGGDAHDVHDNSHLDTHKNNRVLRYKRALEQNEKVRGPYNSNNDSKYVELVLVIDNREYKELGESRSKVEHHSKSIANIINALYSPLNIYIALVGLVIWSEHDEISFSENGDTTLTNFLHYRREKLIKQHPNDNAQLLTKFNFESGVVGKALKGPICTYEYSGGVNTDHSVVVGLVATTVAHEMGHNFGMEHDANNCKCPEERCIMAPSSSAVAPTHWSSCSLNYLLIAFTHGMDYCLKNKPESLYGSPVCGNGFVEPGEECDCGLPEHCENNCCDASTCTLYNNATCATGECCDLETCSIKSAGTLCRSANYECDLPEYCTGESEYCPANIFKLNAESCDEGKAFCYDGFCRTRTDQCKLLWGETGKSSDLQCYQMNTKGTRHGNCGYYKFNQTYSKCENEDVLCGMLHCKHLNERLEFGMESVAILSHSFINLKGSVVPCRTAIVDLGINQIDPGLAPNGAKCGDGKMCVNQKCMAVDSLRRAGPLCPNDCNGNGWCNSLGHCHCKDGYAPPLCDYPGPGGSEDSGPASDPNRNKVFVRAMFIIFLGIIPFLAICTFVSFYLRRNMNWKGWKSTPSTTSKPSPNKLRGPLFQSEPTKRTEDNHSLLQKDPNASVGLQNEFFGNFNGFSISKKKEAEPVRSAPPAPSAPAVSTSITSPPSYSDAVITKTTIVNKTSTVNRTPTASPVKTVSPVRAAPPAPKSPIVNRANTTANAKMNFFKPSSLLTKAHSFKQNSVQSAINNTNNSSVAPALPPPNPGSHARPIISSPVLENSTCTAKELISPLRNAPKVPFRPAPTSPKDITTENSENKRPLSSPEVAINAIVPVPEVEVKKPTATSNALNRITSFLKSNDKKPVVNTNSLPKVNKVKNIDKNALRNMEISSPIPQTEIDIAITALPVDTPEGKAVVMRAQSMRDTSTVKKRPAIATFGSMRNPSGFKRPMSIPSGIRPKSPPPPRPPVTENTTSEKIKIPNLPGYQKPSNKPVSENVNQYDDCLNKTAPLASLSEENSPTTDNIYAVIEESPLSPNVKSNSGSNESMGLLGEIVDEIQNRNFDSIYSTSTLARKKKEQAAKMSEELTSPESLYENTSSSSSIYKSPESVYSNMNSGIKSSASSTSSGYIHPSAVNVPIKPATSDSKETEVKPVENTTKNNLSTFKVDKPFTSTFSRPPGPLASAYSNKSNPFTKSEVTKNENTTVKANENKTKSSPSPTSKTAPKNTQISRQTTPPNLRIRKPSPTRAATTTPPKTSTNRSITNSPDLVTSCNNTKQSSKPPDVLNVKKPSIMTTKPNINGLPKGPLKNTTNKSVTFKSPQEKDKAPVTSKLNKSNSDAGVSNSNNSKNLPSGVKNATRSNSNVASLQQKFENKTNSSAKPIVKAKA